MLGSDGKFYGTTHSGGTYGYGTIFRITSTGTLTTLYSFGGVSGDGQTPEAGLVEDSNGNFYGTTEAGGANGTGSIFKLATGLPVITSAKTATTKVGTSFSYQIIATNSPTQFSVQGLLAGMTVNKQTGLVSGTFTAQQAGKHSLTLQAQNGTGLGVEPLTLTVTNQGPHFTARTVPTASFRFGV